MTRYRRRPEEVDARQVPESDPQGSFLKWTRGRQPRIRVLFVTGTDHIAYVEIDQLGDFKRHANPGDYLVFHKEGKRAERMRRDKFEREYVRC